jgi:hypothetical protein
MLVAPDAARRQEKVEQRSSNEKAAGNMSDGHRVKID